MRLPLTVAMAWALAASGPLAGEVSFTAKPTAAKVGDRVKISFAVSAPTDVAVYIEDAKGEVVRHLVAGVLGGANPPPEPLKPGLAQEVEWDGKADYGKPAEGGPFKVQVGLGLGAKYDRVVRSAMSDLKTTAALAVGPDGTLYSSCEETWSMSRAGSSRWRLFGRDGTYQGTWGMPPGAESARYFGWAFDDGRPDPMNYRAATSFMSSEWLFNTVRGSYAVTVSRDGADLFQIGFPTGDKRPVCIYRYPLTASCPKDDKFRVDLDVGAGQVAVISGGNGLGNWQNPQGCLAASSDGRRLFVGGLWTKGEKGEKPLAAVYAVKCPERTGCQVVFGDPAKPGNDEKSLGGAPLGLAVDGKGHLLIADEANNRVVVIDEKDGRYLGEIATEKPKSVGACARTGAIYVLGVEGRGMALRRFNPGAGSDPRGWKDLKPAAAMPVDERYLAVDEAANPTVIWLGGAWKSTLRVEDPGTGPKFGEAKNPWARAGDNEYGPDFLPFGNVVVDRLRKDVYASAANIGKYQMRFHEKTGEVEIVKLDIALHIGGMGFGLQVVPAPNGNLYSPQFGDKIYQWDHNGKTLAWTEPRRLTPEEAKIGNFPGALKDQLPPNVVYSASAMCSVPHTLSVRWSDGHIFSIEGFRWMQQEIGGRTLKALHEYLPSGKRVTPNDGPIIWKLSDAASGPKFDAAGNIYVAEAVRPPRWVLPQELADYFAKKGLSLEPKGKRGDWYTGYPGQVGAVSEFYGSILKFGPKGGMVHWEKARGGSHGPGANGMEPFTGEPKLDPTLKTMEVDHGGTYLRCGLKVTGAEWVHPGIGHVGFYGCTCENVNFEVDEFGRVFFPDSPLFQVRVIDTAGNPITKFGGYGDANCMGPESSVVDPKTNRVRPRRADDPKDMKSPFAEPELGFSWLVGVGVTDRYAYLGDSLNQRLLRAKLVYAAEETVAVP
jgi:hypothetical protein